MEEAYFALAKARKVKETKEPENQENYNEVKR